jgi:hypothetical protein
MRKLFRSFEASKLRYLLISGQASILYGAAAVRLARLRWAVRTTFNPEDRAEWAREIRRPQALQACRRAVAVRLQRHQARDTAYWRHVIDDLRKQWQGGTLVPRGTPVANLLRR